MQKAGASTCCVVPLCVSWPGAASRAQAIGARSPSLHYVQQAHHCGGGPQQRQATSERCAQVVRNSVECCFSTPFMVSS